jgi:hypothetical protein
MTTFTDNFNRADSSNLGSGWTEVSGDWSISGNRLSPGSAGGVVLAAIANPLATNDNYAQVTIASTAAVSHGVWCRGSSTLTSGYLWRNNGTTWDLFWVVGGSFTVIGTYTAAAAVNDVARVQAVGTTIKGFVNGVERVSVTDTAVSTGTYAGIRSESTASVLFDDFSAGDITSGVAVTPVVEVETTQSLSGSKSRAVSFLTEIETVQNLPAGKNSAVASVSETETAVVISGGKHSAIPYVTEIEGVQQLAGSKATHIPFGSELESALSLGGSKSSALVTSVETEQALPLVGTKRVAVVPVVEHETALQLTHSGEGGTPVAQSILTSVKKMLNIAESDTSFDMDIIIHINSAFATLHQIGIGPDEGFMIEDSGATWSSFTSNRLLNSVKTYMYAQVRLLFDPPNTSFGIEAMERHINQLIWRLNVVREGTEWTDPISLS